MENENPIKEDSDPKIENEVKFDTDEITRKEEEEEELKKEERKKNQQEMKKKKDEDDNNEDDEMKGGEGDGGEKQQQDVSKEEKEKDKSSEKEEKKEEKESKFQFQFPSFSLPSYSHLKLTIQQGFQVYFLKHNDDICILKIGIFRTNKQIKKFEKEIKFVQCHTRKESKEERWWWWRW